ncbi:MAG: hypothetical protein JWQ56_486 [Pseudarthrobacter sp.]|jgi:hypothetical protein|nr:hypothetical protein [Pseudarthrobacter sp.]
MEIVQWIWSGLLGAAALAPLATLGVVLVAYLTYRQRSQADRRDQWWKRAQWAIDSALNEADPPRRLAGLKVLVQLIGSDLATAEDADLMSALAVGIRDQEQDGRRSIAVPPPVRESIVAEAERLRQAAYGRGQQRP